MATLFMPLEYAVNLEEKTKRISIQEPLVQGDKLAHRVTVTVRRGATDASKETFQDKLLKILTDRTA